MAYTHFTIHTFQARSGLYHATVLCHYDNGDETRIANTDYNLPSAAQAKASGQAWIDEHKWLVC